LHGRCIVVSIGRAAKPIRSGSAGGNESEG